MQPLKSSSDCQTSGINRNFKNESNNILLRLVVRHSSMS